MKNKCLNRVENIVRKGEIACYKQFLLFSQCFPLLHIFSASKCGIVWRWVLITFSDSSALVSTVTLVSLSVLVSSFLLFVAFVEDNAIMSSVRYYEYLISYFFAKPKEVDPVKLISLGQISLSIALKYIINNSI